MEMFWSFWDARILRGNSRILWIFVADLRDRSKESPRIHDGIPRIPDELGLFNKKSMQYPKYHFKAKEMLKDSFETLRDAFGFLKNPPGC